MSQDKSRTNGWKYLEQVHQESLVLIAESGTARNYHLCRHCTELECNGDDAEFGCEEVVYITTDRRLPADWSENNIHFALCYVAQMARNANPDEPGVKARIEEVRKRKEKETKIVPIICD